MFKSQAYFARAIAAPTVEFRRALWTGAFLTALTATASGQTITFQGNQLPCISYNIRTAQNGGSPANLTRTTNQQQIAQNRAAACTSAFRNAVAAINQTYPNNRVSCDEYPFASSNQGGGGSRAMIVPLAENNSQGGQLSGFYNQNNIVNNSPYSVATANVPPAPQLPLFTFNGLPGCAWFPATLTAAKAQYTGSLASLYGQIGLWDAADPAAYQVASGPLPWFTQKSVVTAAAETHGKARLQVTVSIASAPPIPEDTDAPTNIITVGRAGVVVGNIAAASVARVAIPAGKYRVDVIQSGPRPEDSTDIHFLLSQWAGPSGK